MTYSRTTMNNFNFINFIDDIKTKYGYAVAKNTHDSMLKLKEVAMTSDYLSELDSPRFIIRFKLHPTTGKLIVETINDKMQGYRYTCSPDRIHRHRAKY
ncbi:hypothetical protein [Lactobacillus gallinarum]|uniref:hypothetical protein n=1 Tax=Lactobacillus gallinarum TaxID=52242 RepID=UPI00388DDFBB